MTAAGQGLNDNRMRAEIAMPIATTAGLNAETAKTARGRYRIAFTIFAGAVMAVAGLVAMLS